MNFREYFPLSEKVNPEDWKTLVLSLLIYLGIVIVARVVSWILGWIIIVGTAVSVLATLVGLYCTVGILLSLLIFFRAV